MSEARRRPVSIKAIAHNMPLSTNIEILFSDKLSDGVNKKLVVDHASCFRWISSGVYNGEISGIIASGLVGADTIAEQVDAGTWRDEI